MISNKITKSNSKSIKFLEDMIKNWILYSLKIKIAKNEVFYLSLKFFSNAFIYDEEFFIHKNIIFC
jgi:hypothetical protein